MYGQGDSCLVITPTRKTILIDGGGSRTTDEFDVGKNTLLPYLLDRKISKIDYLMISHFDADHCNGLIAVLENLQVETILIAKQSENSGEYKKIIEVINKRKQKVKIVSTEDTINVDNDTVLKILYPAKDLEFGDLNNNSIVAKLIYKNFSMLFTGDIEKEAENKIINAYKNTNELEATVLKVAHHGSKTSSIEQIISKINPRIALIRSRKK